MRPVNIYALTRISNISSQERLERQMSGRNHYLKIKKWEIEGLRAFSDSLFRVMESSPELSFYYSFTMPKLGKEFDLLRVNDDSVINIELKSGNVSNDTIRKQLIQNRYYLATLGRNMYFYTYISSGDRLVRLSNSGRLVDAGWEELAGVLERQKNPFGGHIEELFKEDEYLISPLTDPGRFLRQEYFLTLQQKDIRKDILKNIRNKDGSIKHEYSVQGFTGLPGTGKTILLYDIAMQLSKAQRVCVFHFGSHEKELEQLDERLKRVDFYYCDDIHEIIIDKDKINNNSEYNSSISQYFEKITQSNLSHEYKTDKGILENLESNIMMHRTYSAILVDEGHRINETSLSAILDLAKQWMVPVIFSYDKEDAIAPEECRSSGAYLIDDIDGYTKYKLTNRIRMNSELSSFIACVMCVQGRNYRHDYPSVSLVYANDDNEAKILLQNFKRDGYIYIWDDDLKNSQADSNVISFNSNDIEQVTQTSDVKNAITSIETSVATCKEFDKVVMMIDDTFYYDESGYLRCNNVRPDDNRDSGVRNLYHGLSRAKKNVGIVVKGNTDVFKELLYVLQK